MNIPSRQARTALWLLVALLILILPVLTACRRAPEQVEVTRIVEVAAEPQTIEVTRIVEVAAAVEVPDQAGTESAEMARDFDIPFLASWRDSPHANAESRSFTRWDNANPAEVPIACAKCHSTYGFLDFLGMDGSPHGIVSVPAQLGSTIECIACHNDAAAAKQSVVFPSGLEVHNLGPEARCMECHQGRASTQHVNAKLEELALGSDVEDVIHEEITFTNIHYYATAATQYGTLAMGGYEYAGQRYDAKYNHVAGHESCISCHDPHTLQIDVAGCATCHANVSTVSDLRHIRMEGSLVDYDGDGDMSEGIKYEIDGLKELLYGMIQNYAATVSQVPLAYTSEAHPYFFIDTNANGKADSDEAVRENAYNGWTPRLSKAAYNYQVASKDPGGYAHGGKYIIQLLYDSIQDLNSALPEPVDTSALSRLDHGHFAGSEASFRYWDATGMVPANCATCHSGNGLPFLLTNNVQIAHAPTDGLNCTSCHTDQTSWATFKVEQVTFPSGARLTLDDTDSNLCLMCHMGRESGVGVRRLIGDSPADEVSEALRFLNPHFFAAGATLFGSEAEGAFQYPGKSYGGRFEHVRRFNTCTECHDTHSQEVEVLQCAICHDNVETRADLKDIRFARTDIYIDYDGDGNNEEGIRYEIETMYKALYVALQKYAAETAGVPIVYASSHPYFFVDTNGNGVADRDEINRANAYNSWTPRLLRAAYNYQYTSKDTGGYAHNPTYLLQILYDSLEDIGVPMAGMSRPR